MAKLKKSANSSTAKSSGKASKSASNAESLRASRSISESAQQIWLAGMGAFNRAQAEGGRLFESLVRDGLSLEQTARRFAGNRANVMKGAMEGRVDQAKERAADTWDKLEKVFEERVQRALVKLGVPGRDDLNALTERVERLTSAVRQYGAAPAKQAAKPAGKRTPKQAAAKPGAKPGAKPASKPAKAGKATKASKSAKAGKATSPASEA